MPAIPAVARRPTILIVDDQPAMVAFVDGTLRLAGYETVGATAPLEALQIAKALDHLDLLVTDLHMPVMNGDEVARQLRRERPDLKVLYVTGDSAALFDDRALLWDNEAFLDKPCTMRGLLETVGLLLADHFLDTTAVGSSSFKRKYPAARA